MSGAQEHHRDFLSKPAISLPNVMMDSEWRTQQGKVHAGIIKADGSTTAPQATSLAPEAVVSPLPGNWERDPCGVALLFGPGNLLEGFINMGNNRLLAKAV